MSLKRYLMLTSLGLVLTLADTAVAARSAEDTARDAGRKPAEVLAFLGLEPGDTALDVWASGGWYTEILSEAVGAEGIVYSQNPPVVLEWADGRLDKALGERLANGRLANVIRVDQALADGPIEPGSIDVAITALNLHDIYNSEGEAAAVALFRQVFAALKPGGVFGVIDHVGVPGADNAGLHRMQIEQAHSAAQAAGFVVEATSSLLAIADDDHSKTVFDDAVRGRTDRFLLRLRKPE